MAYESASIVQTAVGKCFYCHSPVLRERSSCTNPRVVLPNQATTSVQPRHWISKRTSYSALIILWHRCPGSNDCISLPRSSQLAVFQARVKSAAQIGLLDWDDLWYFMCGKSTSIALRGCSGLRAYLKQVPKSMPCMRQAGNDFVSWKQVYGDIVTWALAVAST